MAMEITNNYSSYVMQGMAGSSAANRTQSKETEKTSQTTEDRPIISTAGYMSELTKLVPATKCMVGDGFSTMKKGRTLTINPKLLEEMHNNPEKEQEIKELMKGIGLITKFLDGMYKACGWSVVYHHSYIDENGEYHQISHVRNDYMLNMSDKLREERRKNSEKLMEKTKERLQKKREELEKKQGLMKGVKPITRLMGGVHKTNGRSVVYRYSYIDENGDYREISHVRNDNMLNMSERLREERRKNSEKLVERTRERAEKKKEEMEEMIMAISGVDNYGNAYESMYDLQKAKHKEVREQNKSKTSNETRAKEGQQKVSLKSGTQQDVSNQEYLNQLQGHRTHVKLSSGMGLSMKIDQKQGAVTINPELLEKMQNDPEAEKKYTELIKNIEMAEKTVGAYYSAMGGYVERTSHWYIDENGNYTHFGYVRRDDKLNKKLREEAKKNAEELIEKSREKVAEKRKKLEETMKKRMEEKKEEASGDNSTEKEEMKESAMNESELLNELSSTAGGIQQAIRLLEGRQAGLDGSIFFGTKDMQPIIDAVKGVEQEERRTARAVDKNVAVGSSVDVVI